MRLVVDLTAIALACVSAAGAAETPAYPQGAAAFQANCAVCHRPDGKGAGPVKPLDASPVVLDADKNAQITTVLHGRLNGAMPAWQTLNDDDLAAALNYVSNAWDNGKSLPAGFKPFTSDEIKALRAAPLTPNGTGAVTPEMWAGSSKCRRWWQLHKKGSARSTF